MGRRRALMLAPAITRMQCMKIPYERVKNGAEGEEKEAGGGEGAVKRRRSFWPSWRTRKTVKRGGSRGTARRRSGFRVSKLRIRMLWPGYWLKKLRDSYIDMMLELERNAPMDCSGMVTYPAHTAHQHFPGAVGGGGGAWIWPTMPPPVVF
jgi:hypothetical protein